MTHQEVGAEAGAETGAEAGVAETGWFERVRVACLVLKEGVGCSLEQLLVYGTSRIRMEVLNQRVAGIQYTKQLGMPLGLASHRGANPCKRDMLDWEPLEVLQRASMFETGMGWVALKASVANRELMEQQGD